MEETFFKNTEVINKIKLIDSSLPKLCLKITSEVSALISQMNQAIVN